MPDFIEVKGVTYCGNSKASPLTIKNTPYHEEVCMVRLVASLLCISFFLRRRLSGCKSWSKWQTRRLDRILTSWRANISIPCAFSLRTRKSFTRRAAGTLGSTMKSFTSCSNRASPLRASTTCECPSVFLFLIYWLILFCRAPTADWAVFGASEKGFDPEEKRFYRNGKEGKREQLFEEYENQGC